MTIEQEQLKAYYDGVLTTGCPFKVGDWVTPKEGSRIKGAGEPHLVVQAYDTVQYHNMSIMGSNCMLQQFDMIVLCLLDSIPLSYIAESVDYEEYHERNV